MATIRLQRWISERAMISIARWLTVASKPRAADAIAVLGGGMRTRAEYGARLYHEGYAPSLVVSGGLLQLLGPVESWAAISQRIAVQMDVPEEAIHVLGGCYTTWEEACRVRELAAQQHFRSLILVSDHIHGRRAFLTFRRVLPGLEITFSGVDDPRYTLDDWWRNEIGLVQVLNEYLKLLYYWREYGVEPWRV